MNNSSPISTSQPNAAQPNAAMATEAGNPGSQPEHIPLIGINGSGNTNSASEPAHDVHRNPNADIEAHEAEGPAADEEALPEYKEEDMGEPLPPYMARVRRVIQGQEPMSTIMPDKRTGGAIVGGFVLIVLIIVGVSVGVTISSNKNGNNNSNQNNQ